MLEQKANALVDKRFAYITGILAVLTGATLLWSVFGRLKIESTGVGIIVRGQHFFTVNSKQQGVVARQFFQLNDTVKAGDILMSLDTQSDKLSLDASQKTLTLSRPLTSASDTAGQRAEIFAYENVRKAEIFLIRNAPSLKSLINKQQLAYQGMQSLYAEGQVSSDELASAFSSLAQLKQQLSNLETNYREQQINYEQIKQSNAQAKLNLESQNIATAANLDQSLLALDQSKFIRSPINGTIVSYGVQLGGYANPGDQLVSIAPSDGPLRAILLVGSDQFARIKNADRVLVSPSASPSIRFGYIRGSVISKGDAPATSAELLKAFGSPEIVQALQQSFSQGNQVNLPYLVVVQLEEKNKLPVWTMGRQPPWGLQPGSQTTARIISEQVRPISLLLPFLR